MITAPPSNADQAIAQIVAQSVAVEVLTDPAPPTLGTQSGMIVNGGRRWRWSRTARPSPEPRIQQIEIRVANGAGGPGRAALTIFRRVAP